MGPGGGSNPMNRPDGPGLWGLGMTGQFLVYLAFLFSSFLSLPEAPVPQEDLEECTAGVASGRATADGRPLLWKTRDAGATNNEVIWNTTGTYPFVSVITAGDPSSSWMGVNEKGFAIINTLSTDLTAGRTGLHNGLFMAYALQEAATVEEFEELLKETNESGRMTNTNYGVIDATGAAAFFETAGHEYWRYDAADTEKGYILRTNFAVNGDRSRGDPPGSIEGHEVGYLPNNSSINRNSSVSFAVIQGVYVDEDPRLSTMWTILGQPSTGITVPYWPVGETPPEANGPETAPLADAANRIKQELYEEYEGVDPETVTVRPLFINTHELMDENGDGIWNITMPLEDSIIAEAEGAREGWRASGVDDAGMLELEGRLARQALAGINRALDYLIRGH